MAHQAHAELWPTTVHYADGSCEVRWYFHRIAANGKVTDPSQAYSSRRSARRGILRRWPGVRIDFYPHRPR